MVDGDRIYAVADVIATDQRTINDDCIVEVNYNHEDNASARKSSFCASGVSRRMIEQFFTEVEGPDRDW